MNTILIDFKNTSDKELKIIASKFNVSYSYLIELRDEFFIERVIMDLDQKMILSYKYNDVDGFFHNDDVFETIKPYRLEVPKDIVLDVDIILEKISKFGIESLEKEEKEFLDNFSKD